MVPAVVDLAACADLDVARCGRGSIATADDALTFVTALDPRPVAGAIADDTTCAGLAGGTEPAAPAHFSGW